MGKSKTGGAFGFINKSIGSVTYSTMKDKNGKRVQILRAKPTDVTNPNTVAQILQRMKVKPAARFYNTLEEILNNAWEGVRYGADSRREFMRLAMGMTGPYVPRGASRVIPAVYPVSRGSVPTPAGVVFAEDESINSKSYGKKAFMFDMTGTGFDAGQGNWPQSIVDVYGRAVQFTFIAVTVDGDGNYKFGYNRVLSSDLPAYNQQTMPTLNWKLQVGDAIVYTYNWDSDNILYFGKGTDIPATAEQGALAVAGVVAAAVIVSYKENDVWHRSNADMVINEALQVNLYGSEAMNVAIESYQNSASVNELNSNWYLNLANGQQYPGRISLMNYTIETTIQVEGEPQTLTKDVTIPVGQRVNTNGILQSYPFTSDGTNAGDVIFFSDGEYKALKWQAGDTANIKANEILFQIGLFQSELWKEVYSIQIGA